MPVVTETEGRRIVEGEVDSDGRDGREGRPVGILEVEGLGSAVGRDIRNSYPAGFYVNLDL